MGSEKNISFHLPSWDVFEKMADGIWEREYYTNQGPLAIELELQLQKFLGVKHAVCMTNSSIALMISILAMETKGKAVIPALSHVNVAQSVQWAGMEPVFCDIRPDSPVIDADQLAQTASKENAGVIIAINIFGLACDIGKIENYSRQNHKKLIFISDSVFGQAYEGKMFGGFGDLEIFSFHQSQLINGGDGACVTTNDDLLAAKLRNIRSSYGAGKAVPIPYTGNGRMSEIQAGLAVLSLQEMKKRTEGNKKRFEEFNRIFSKEQIVLLSPCNKCTNHTYTEIVLNAEGKRKTQLQEKLSDSDIAFEDFSFYGIDVLNQNVYLILDNFRIFIRNALLVRNSQNILVQQINRLARII